MAYIGKAPNTAIVNQATSQSFSGNGSATAFTLNRSVNVGEDLEVFVNNVQQEPGSGKSYTASGTTLTFDEAPPSGTNNVYVIYRGEATINPRLEHDANAALAATTGTFSGAVSATTGTFSSDVDISGSSGATLKLTSTDTSGADTELLGQIDFVSSDSSTGSAGTQARIKGVYEDNGDSTGIAFLAGNSTGSGTPTISEVMRIRHEGKVAIGTSTAVGTLTTQCTAGDSNFALTAYHPTGTSARTIAKFQSNVGGTQADKVTIGCDGKVTISDGDLVIGTSGHGINFSATSDAGNSASMGAELFDDYEEGAWTPTASAGSGSAASFTASNSLYTKIGRMVFVRAEIRNINTSGTTGSAGFRITGFPFTIDVADAYGVAFADNLTLQGSRTQLSVAFDTAEFAKFIQSGGTGSETGTDHNDMNSGVTDIFFQGVYFSNQ